MTATCMERPRTKRESARPQPSRESTAPSAVTPENAESYLRFARAVVAAMAVPDRALALSNGGHLLDGLFTIVADDIPLSDEEQTDIAAYEWTLADGEITPYLLGRIKRGILNVAVARLIAGLAERWTARTLGGAARGRPSPPPPYGKEAAA